MEHPAGGFGKFWEKGRAGGSGAPGGKKKDGSSDTNPASSAPPSVVGYAANMTRDPFAFVGDFDFQEAQRDEKLDVLVRIVNDCVGRFRQARGHMPSSIVIYRNGCSEGQFKNIVQFEVPLIQTVLSDIGCTAKITLIVPQKQHNVRIFRQTIDPRARPTEQNIPAGTVVDHTIVDAVKFEFYLAPHTALQGSTKTLASPFW
jgi:eukaryotic translation initiation factor 2C